MCQCIIANGCFDILHAGHFMFLQYCYELSKQLNCKVVVGLDSDEKIQKDKGKFRPFFSFKDRKKLLLQTGFVDSVFEFNTNEELANKIKEHRPLHLIKDISWKEKVVGSEYADVLYFKEHVDISTSTIEEVVEKRLREKIKHCFPNVDLW